MDLAFTDMDKYRLPDIDFSRSLSRMDRSARLAQERADIDQLCDEVADTYTVRLVNIVQYFEWRSAIANCPKGRGVNCSKSLRI